MDIAHHDNAAGNHAVPQWPMQSSNELAMSDPIAFWRAEHANFAMLLDLLEGELERFHKGEPPDYELMLDIMFYMTHYPDVLHHPKEDLAFAWIKDREAGAAPTVDQLTAQHFRLKEHGDALVVALDDIVNGSITTRDHVEVPGRAYIADFRGHMQVEESVIIPLGEKLLGRSDWVAINAAIRHVDDPLFGAHKVERYAALRRQIARAARTSKTKPR
jgi:hemerythrin-like domain-containing protein